MHNRGQTLRPRTSFTHTPRARAHLRTIPQVMRRRKQELDKGPAIPQQRKLYKGIPGDAHKFSRMNRNFTHTEHQKKHHKKPHHGFLDKLATNIEKGLAGGAEILEKGGSWWGSHVPVVGPVINAIDHGAGFIIGGFGKQIHNYHEQFKEDSNFGEYMATIGEIGGDIAVATSGLGIVSGFVAQTEFDIAMDGLHDQLVGNESFADHEKAFHGGIFNVGKRLIEKATGGEQPQPTDDSTAAPQNTTENAGAPPADEHTVTQ